MIVITDDDETTEPISWQQLPPGFQLDSVIAFYDGYLVTGAGGGFLWGLRPGHPDLPLTIPKYSTDTNAAIDLLKDRDCWILRPSPVLRPKRMYLCEFYDPLPGGEANWTVSERADTPAMAICRAYLIWKGA